MASWPAIEILPGIWRIPTLGWDVINSFALVADDGSVTLVDCGFSYAPPLVVAALRRMGKHPRDVTRIVLTHAHPDHSGGAAALVKKTGAAVALHEAEVPWATAGRALQKSDTTYLGGRLYNRLSAQKFRPFEVSQPLRDGDEVAGAGLIAVHTPGHSPGHVALLHGDSGTVITGDAMMNFRWLGMSLPAKALCSDFALTQETSQRFVELDYENAAFTHGPEILGRGRDEIRNFLATLGRA